MYEVGAQLEKSIEPAHAPRPIVSYSARFYSYPFHHSVSRSIVSSPSQWGNRLDPGIANDQFVCWMARPSADSE